MVTGSVASSYHGRPRSTHDADIVIDPNREQLDAFLGQPAFWRSTPRSIAATF